MPKAKLDILVGESNGTPGFTVNNLIIQPAVLLPGNHTIEFDYEYGQSIEFKMFGKNKQDVILENGKVIRDKFVLIQNLTLEFLVLESWHFHNYIFDPYFGFDNESKYLHLPTKKDFPIWYVELLV